MASLLFFVMKLGVDRRKPLTPSFSSLHCLDETGCPTPSFSFGVSC
jgi:hypothetical protein